MKVDVLWTEIGVHMDDCLWNLPLFVHKTTNPLPNTWNGQVEHGFMSAPLIH